MTHRADAETLLRHTAWLRALAYAILADVHQAEDVAQDACRIALERAPAGADEHGRRAWLGEVARNLALLRRRADLRRAARERDAARAERVVSAAETVERVAAQRALVDAVLALDGLERDVVVLRYFRGWPPRRIARELGLSGTAVRSRLARALAKLRARLGDEHGIDARALALVAARGSGSFLGVGIVSATVKLALAAGIVLALPAAFLLLRVGGTPAGSPVPPVPDTEVALALELDAPSGDRAPRTAAATEAQRDPAAAQATPSQPEPARGELLVVQARIVDGSGTPLEGARLVALGTDEPFSASSGADGRARLEIPWERWENESWAKVEASCPGWTRLQRQERIVGPAVVELGDVQLEPGGNVAGRVVDERGAGLAHAQVYAVGATLPGTAEREEERRVLGSPFPLLEASRAWTTSAQDGEYRIEGVPARPISVVARTAGRTVAYTPPLEIRRGMETVAPDLVLRPPSGENAIRGVLLDAQGPVAGAQVSAFENHARRNTNPLALTLTDAKGCFELVVLSRAVHTLEAEHPGQRGFEVVVHDVRAGDHGLRMVFPVRRSIQVDVLGPEGEPVHDVWLLAFEESGLGLFTTYEALPGGGARLDLPTVGFRLSVQAQGYLPRQLGPYDPSTVPERIAVELTRAGALRGRVTAGGAPVPGARVHVHRPPTWGPLASFEGQLLTRWDSHDGRPPSTESDEEGHFELFLRGADQFLLHAEAEGHARAEAGPFELVEGQSVEDVELALTSGATLIGRVLVAEGVPLAGTVVAITRGDGHVDSAVLGPDGAYRFDHRTPGGWQVRRGKPEDLSWLREGNLRPVRDPSAELPVDAELREGETTVHDLDFTHELPCTMLGRIALDGGWESGWSASLFCAGHRASGTVAPDGSFALSILGPGEASLGLWSSPASGGQSELLRSVTLAPGENRLEWSLTSGELELTGLRPSEPSDRETRLAGYALLHPDADGGTWSLTFDPDEEGRWSGERVPAGKLELRRRTAQQQRPTSWPVLQVVEVKAGARTRIALGEER